MSISKWAYIPEMCDGDICPGECDICPKADEMKLSPSAYWRREGQKVGMAVAAFLEGMMDVFGIEEDDEG